MSDFVFQREFPAIGVLSLRRLDLERDLACLHRWVSAPYAQFWGLTGASEAEVRAVYQGICREAEVWLGYHGQTPAYLVETYDPRNAPVGEYYRTAPGDRGMHLLVAPTEQPIAGFTLAVMRCVLEFLFSTPDVERVVVEPDLRNTKIHALNRKVGFRYQRILELPNKTAHLAFCTRNDFDRARRSNWNPFCGRQASTADSAMSGDTWRAVNRQLTAKAIAELCHERLLVPRPIELTAPWARYELACDATGESYEFRARRLSLEHWDVDPSSLGKRTIQGVQAPDLIQFFIDQRAALQLSDAVLPSYIQELCCSLYARHFSEFNEACSAADLVHASFQEIEAAMTGGHPGFVANAGRIGFDLLDHASYAPESRSTFELLWLAVRRERAVVATVGGLDFTALLRTQLGDERLAAFDTLLRARGLAPTDYHYLPVHPWQWTNRIAQVFAPELAADLLVLLGPGPGRYRPQQSIRTALNLDAPQQHYVKTALSVLNMGFTRGLSAEYMRATPAINQWVAELVGGDVYLQQKGFRILREVAAVGFDDTRLEPLCVKTSPYRKQLAALFRESPVGKVRPGQRLMTMAALLHRDAAGTAFLPQLIRASGLDVGTWLRRYFDCYVIPVVHCLCRYDLAFMPHGENVILVLEDNAPVGAFMKDIGEEVSVMSPRTDVPSEARRICIDAPVEIRALALFTDVFDGFLRHLSALLDGDAAHPEARFWHGVAACIERYYEEQPAARHSPYDFFVSEFRHSCLNRLQLRNNRQMVDLTDPVASLQFAGSLKNPIATYAPNQSAG